MVFAVSGTYRVIRAIRSPRFSSSFSSANGVEA
jgi:hypothetical protein